MKNPLGRKILSLQQLISVRRLRYFLRFVKELSSHPCKADRLPARGYVKRSALSPFRTRNATELSPTDFSVPLPNPTLCYVHALLGEGGGEVCIIRG